LSCDSNVQIQSLFSSNVVLQWDQIKFEPAGSAKMSP